MRIVQPTADLLDTWETAAKQECEPVLDALFLGLTSEPIERCGSRLNIARHYGWISGGTDPGTVPNLTESGQVVIKALRDGAQA